MPPEPAELTFAFADLAGFTALTEAHGDHEAIALIERLEALVREALGPGGRLVKTIGDAVMLCFASPIDGLEATERLLASTRSEAGFPSLRVGFHHGTAVERGDDFFGASVNLAARVAGQAHGGQVLATQAVAEAGRAAGWPVVDLGAFTLRNLTDPIELYEIELSPVDAGMAIDPVCRMQVPRAAAAGRLRHQGADHWFCSLACASKFAASPASYGRS